MCSWLQVCCCRQGLCRVPPRGKSRIGLNRRSIRQHYNFYYDSQVLSGFLAGAALTISGAANAAATPVDIIDDRKAIAKGFLDIYEARDSTLPENQRQGRTQARADIKTTLAHAKASEARIDNDLEPSIKKNYWCVSLHLVYSDLISIFVRSDPSVTMHYN